MEKGKCSEDDTTIAIRGLHPSSPSVAFDSPALFVGPPGLMRPAGLRDQPPPGGRRRRPGRRRKK